MDQFETGHKWNEEARMVDEQVRAAGCIALVDVDKETLFMWPAARCPKSIYVQLGLNSKALGRQYCRDLLAEAGYNPPEKA